MQGLADRKVLYLILFARFFPLFGTRLVAHIRGAGEAFLTAPKALLDVGEGLLESLFVGGGGEIQPPEERPIELGFGEGAYLSLEVDHLRLPESRSQIVHHQSYQLAFLRFAVSHLRLLESFRRTSLQRTAGGVETLQRSQEWLSWGMRSPSPEAYSGIVTRAGLGSGLLVRPSWKGAGDGGTGSRDSASRRRRRYHHQDWSRGDALRDRLYSGLRDLPSCQRISHGLPGGLRGVRPEQRLDHCSARRVFRLPPALGRSGSPLLLRQREAGSWRGARALRPRRRGDDGGLLYGPASRRWRNPEVCGGYLGKRTCLSEGGSLRRCRGGAVDRDRDEQPLVLPGGTYLVTLRACYRSG